MRNPKNIPVIPAPVTGARLNALQTLVDNYLTTQAARSDVDDGEIVALAPDFAAVPGTLKALKDRLNLA